jgi:acetyl-CoA acetyltransferase
LMTDERTIKGRTAIVGVGATEYYPRGRSLPRTQVEMACSAIIAAMADAGLPLDELDGFTYYTHGADTSLIAQTLGIPEVRFTAGLTGGGGGAAGSVGLAAAAIVSGQANVVVTLLSLQQAARRLGAAFAPQASSGGGGAYAYVPTPEKDFNLPFGLLGPGQAFAMLARRHMHLYGTRREHFAEVALSSRANAIRRPTSIMREPLTLDEYFAARMIAEPLCLYDFCLESDGAVAVVTTTAARARDLRQPPVYVVASAHGGAGRWGQAITWMNMPDEYFTSTGHRPIATRVYEQAGVGPGDIDVALLYDHFTPMVLMQLEDYGFCEIGGSGDFVADGNIRWPQGRIPVNTHGGNLSEAYLIGMTHIREAVEQIRGSAVNQVDGAELALTTGGPAAIPTSALILGRQP